MKKRLLVGTPMEPTTSLYEAALLTAEIGDVPEIDLHGCSVADAPHELDGFVYALHPQGTHALKIIHGRGTGKMRQAVHAWLSSHTDIVGAYGDAQDASGGAVTYVALRKND